MDVLPIDEHTVNLTLTGDDFREPVRIQVRYHSIGHRFVIQVGDRRWQAVAVADVHGVWLHLQGRTVYLQRVPVSHAVRDTRDTVVADSVITAPMTGRIVDIRVQPGETVPAGTVLAVLEAMKMELQIEAPAHVHIEAVHVRAGDLVQQGDVLIVTRRGEHRTADPSDAE